MKLLIFTMLSLIAATQAMYWFGDNGVGRLQQLEIDIAEQQALNAELAARNQAVEIEVLDLKNGLEAVEERARSELGMIGANETFYLLVD